MEFISLYSFPYVIFSYLVTYFIGHIAVAFLKIPTRYPFLNEFTKLVVSGFIIITGYSTYKSTGITINIGILFLAVIFLIWCKRSGYLNTLKDAYPAIFTKRFIPYLAIQLILLLISFAFLLSKIKNPATGEIHEVFSDFYNYSKNIQNLKKTGIEAILNDWYSGIPSNRALYHFGELWQAAFYSAITFQSPFFAFYFQLFSLYLVVFILGAAALVEIFIHPSNKFFYLLSILILITCGISFYIPSDTFFTKGDWWNVSLTFQPKYFFPTIFVFYALVLTKFNKLVPLQLVSIACIFCCSVITPAVLIFTGLLLLYLFFSKRINFSSFLQLSLISVFAVVFIGAYYLCINYLNSKHISDSQIVSASTFSFSWFLYFKTAFNCFAGQLIKNAMSFIFYILLLFFLVKTKDKDNNGLIQILVIIVLIHIASLLSYALFNTLLDAVQLWSNIYIPLAAIFGFITVIYLIYKGSNIQRLAAAMLLFLCYYQANIFYRFPIINQKYFNEVAKRYDGGTTVFYKSGDDFISFFSKNVNLYSPSAFLIMKYDEYNPVCLSVLDIPRSKEKVLYDGEAFIIRNSIFNKFIQVQKQHKKFVSSEQSQLDFIKDNNVKYAFTYPNATLPPNVRSMVQYSVTDSLRGVTFYQLQ